MRGRWPYASHLTIVEEISGSKHITSNLRWLRTPGDFPRGLWSLGRAYADKGMWREAIATHERLASVAPQRGAWNAMGLAYVHTALGTRTRHLLRGDPRFAALMRRFRLPDPVAVQPRQGTVSLR